MSFEVVARLKLSVDKDCLACAQAFVRNSVGAPVDNDIQVEGIEHIEEE